MNEQNAVAPEQRIADDLRTLIAEGEEMLRGVAADANVATAEARGKLIQQLETARVRLVEVERQAVERTRAAARATNDWVHENPWQAVGIAAGVGVAIGLLISRK